MMYAVMKIRVVTHDRRFLIRESRQMWRMSLDCRGRLVTRFPGVAPLADSPSPCSQY